MKDGKVEVAFSFPIHAMPELWISSCLEDALAIAQKQESETGNTYFVIKEAKIPHRVTTPLYYAISKKALAKFRKINGRTEFEIVY